MPYVKYNLFNLCKKKIGVNSGKSTAKALNELCFYTAINLFLVMWTAHQAIIKDLYDPDFQNMCQTNVLSPHNF